MNPKEKALELIEQFENTLNPDSQTYKCNECKFCAIHCVDEILCMLENILESPKESIAYRYYLEVKSEIEKLM